jgi:hypothetical protein
MTLLPCLLSFAAQEALPVDLSAEVPPVLRLDSGELPRERNAYYALVAAAARIPRDLQGRFEMNWDRPSPQPAATLLRRTASAAQAMDAAMRTRRFQWPRVSIEAWSRSKGLVLDYPSMKLLVRARVARARAFATTGRHTDAARELAAAMRLGQAMTRGDALAIGYLVGLSSEAVGNRGALNYLRKFSVPPAAVSLIRAALPPASRVDPDLARTYRAEYNQYTRPLYERTPLAKISEPFRMDLDGEDPPANPWPLDDPDLFDRRATFRMATRVFVRHVVSAGRSWPKRDQEIYPYVMRLTGPVPEPPDPADDEAEVAQFREAVRPIPNALGRYLVSIGPVTDLYPSAIRRLAERELLRSSLALEGNPRAKVTAFDPAGQSTIRQDRKIRRLWSVGPDGRDDRGRGDDIIASY